MLALVSLALLGSSIISTVDAKLLADFNPAVAGASVSKVGGLNYSPCPVQNSDCTGAANPGTAKTFYVKNGRYNFDKPAKFDRTEVHGLKGNLFKENQTYYLSWDFAVSAFPPVIDCKGQQGACNVQDNRIFQYHTFGSPNTLNIPLQLLISPGSNKVKLYGMKYDTSNSKGRSTTTLWTSPALTAGQIYTAALRITTSRNPSKGVVQWWFNGVQQAVAPGGQMTKYMQTWDGVSVDPKWGVYGAWETALKTTIGRIRLGTTYKDVRPQTTALSVI